MSSVWERTAFETLSSADFEAELVRNGVPELTIALLSALRFTNPSLLRLSKVSDSEWPALLTWCDQRQITLLLAKFCGSVLPLRVQQQIAGKRLDFERRMERIKRQLADISNVLSKDEIPFVVLKGFTHSPELSPDPVLRAQGDIDLWCPHGLADGGYRALQRIGYKPGPRHSSRHLSPLVLPEPWSWNGNLAEIPISVELHHELWVSGAGQLALTGFEEMWARRQQRTFEDCTYEVLAKPDLLGFAALHFFLHLINGDLPLQRLWEIAYFLHHNAQDLEFWNSWRASHPPELKRIEALVFRVASEWFGCSISGCLDEEFDHLPHSAKSWLQQLVFSPLKAQADFNKNYVWLHLAFITTVSAQVRVIRRALIPASLPNFIDRNGANPIASLLRQRTYLLSRLSRHTRGSAPTLAGGVQWLANRAGFERGFGPFLLASALFDIGEFLFVLLYNLYLLDLGLREDVLGLVTAAMTAGTLAGSPIAALLSRRVGLKGLLVIACLGCGTATLLRTTVEAKPLLLMTAALNGIFFSFWAVAFSPVVAGLTRPRMRSFAFGVVTALGMSVGIGIGVIGVRIPEWISALSGEPRRAGMRTAMVLGGVLVSLAAIPAMRLRLRPDQEQAENTYPRGRFVRRFTFALFLWIAATSSFNGFGMAYLSLHLHLKLHQIGTVFTAGQSLQVLAMLCGPLLIRSLGEKHYLFATALGTAGAFVLLAFVPGYLGPAAYLLYLTLQYMNEPSLFALLMNRTLNRERAGASSLMFITMSVAGILAAALAGKGITRFDYPACLCAAAILALISALAFLFLPAAQEADLAGTLQEHNKTFSCAD